MRFAPIIFAAAAASTIHGLSFPDVRSTIVQYADKLRRALPEYGSVLTRSPAAVQERASCPAVWTSIVSEMSALFLDNSTKPSQCNDDARSAIRVRTILPYKLSITNRIIRQLSMTVELGIALRKRPEAVMALSCKWPDTLAL